MRYVDNNDNNGDDEFDDFVDDGAYKNLMSQQNALEGFHLHIMEKNLKNKILYKSIKCCEESFFWNFYSVEKRLSCIKKVYEEFIDLLEMKDE